MFGFGCLSYDLQLGFITKHSVCFSQYNFVLWDSVLGMHKKSPSSNRKAEGCAKYVLINFWK